jgi:hypothetical protein
MAQYISRDDLDLGNGGPTDLRDEEEALSRVVTPADSIMNSGYRQRPSSSASIIIRPGTERNILTHPGRSAVPPHDGGPGGPHDERGEFVRNGAQRIDSRGGVFGGQYDTVSHVFSPIRGGSIDRPSGVIVDPSGTSRRGGS